MARELLLRHCTTLSARLPQMALTVANKVKHEVDRGGAEPIEIGRFKSEHPHARCQRCKGDGGAGHEKDAASRVVAHLECMYRNGQQAQGGD